MLDLAVDAHCGAILVDTFDKSRGGLLNHISQSELDSILRRSKAESLLAVVGGSLDPTAIGQIAALSPDVIAVRTAVCRDKRTGPIDGEKVRGLKKVVANLFVKTS